MNITIKGNGNNPVELNADNLQITTAGDVVKSSVVQQIFGVGDDMRPSVNGAIVDNNFSLSDGDVVTLTSGGHGKGFNDEDPIDTNVIIRSGGNELSFNLADIGRTAAEILASQLIQTAFGIGDDHLASINGERPTRDAVEVEPGDTVTLSTGGHGKGRVS